MWHTLCSGVTAGRASTRLWLRTLWAPVCWRLWLPLATLISAVLEGRRGRGPVERSAANTVTSTPWTHSNLLDSGGAEETVMIVATPLRLFLSIPRETVKIYLHA
ncbi:peptide hydrolase [Trypanosoma cruzi]|nr:peptide hydrolase [Trypanosoma cruzi]